MTVFPHSTVIDSTVDNGILAEIADEALNAFFKVVCDRLDDYYPDGKTWGDVDPLAALAQERIALDWIRSFALNHPTICAATEAAESLDD